MLGESRWDEGGGKEGTTGGAEYGQVYGEEGLEVDSSWDLGNLAKNADADAGTFATPAKSVPYEYPVLSPDTPARGVGGWVGGDIDSPGGVEI